ncbi:TPA: hypothetical protein H1940_004767 [Salmonella enterica]|nr:hypothetical protein [Salmonella enterica]
MSHIKIAGYRMPRIHLPRIVIGSHEEKDHYGYHSRAHEHVSAMAGVHERISNPPHTWEAYHDKPGGMMSIVEMEYKELMEMKEGGSRHKIEKELEDLAAACICALEKMKSM